MLQCHFFGKTIGSSNTFTLIENNFRFKKVKFEFKPTVHCGQGGDPRWDTLTDENEHVYI